MKLVGITRKTIAALQKMCFNNILPSNALDVPFPFLDAVGRTGFRKIYFLRLDVDVYQYATNLNVSTKSKVKAKRNS